MKEGDGSIRDLYGLEVKVSQLDCPIKESEEGIADKYFAIDEIREEVKLKQQQDKKLREKILALTEDIGSDDRAEEEIDKIKNYRKTLKVEIEDLNRQLENEKQRLKSSESESRRDSINLLQSGIPKQRNLLEETQETESQFHQSQTTPHSSSQEDEIEPSLKTVDAEVIDDDSSN
jgi:hypothetical protein